MVKPDRLNPDTLALHAGQRPEVPRRVLVRRRFIRQRHLSLRMRIMRRRCLTWRQLAISIHEFPTLQ